MSHKHMHHHDHEDHHEPRRGGRARRGFGPGFGPGFAADFGAGFPGRGPRGGRNRGDVRTAMLVLLAEQPRHGYDLIRAIEERSEGVWTPSPGSIYPTLQALEDEGLISFETVDGRKTASLTDAGRAWIDEHKDHAESVFSRDKRPAEFGALRDEMHGIHEALMLIGRRRSPELATGAIEILATARKDLYRLLAEQ